jgi:hypothetical protein
MNERYRERALKDFFLNKGRAPFPKGVFKIQEGRRC